MDRQASGSRSMMEGTRRQAHLGLKSGAFVPLPTSSSPIMFTTPASPKIQEESQNVCNVGCFHIRSEVPQYVSSNHRQSQAFTNDVFAHFLFHLASPTDGAVSQPHVVRVLLQFPGPVRCTYQKSQGFPIHLQTSLSRPLRGSVNTVLVCRQSVLLVHASS